MNLIQAHITTGENLGHYFLAAETEYSVEGRGLTFYNTLFDFVLLCEAHSEEAARRFVAELERGVEDLPALLRETFTQEPDAVLSLLMNKKIIE